MGAVGRSLMSENERFTHFPFTRGDLFINLGFTIYVLYLVNPLEYVITAIFNLYF